VCDFGVTNTYDEVDIFGKRMFNVCTRYVNLSKEYFGIILINNYSQEIVSCSLYYQYEYLTSLSSILVLPIKRLGPVQQSKKSACTLYQTTANLL